MAYTREDIIDSIENEFGYLSEHIKLSIANDYNDANHYERFYENIDEELVDYCNDSLEKYFALMSSSKDTYTESDRYFYTNGQGFLTSFDDIEDELDMHIVAEFIYDHWDDYESHFDDTSLLIEENEDEEDEDEEEE